MPKAMYIVAPEDFVQSGATTLERELLSAFEDARYRSRLDTSPEITVCLAGGSTPRPVYEALVANAHPLFPWGDIQIWLGDERWVHAHHPESNWLMIRNTIQGATSMDNRSLHSIDTSCDSPDSAAWLYEKTLPAHAEFDLMVLGVGTDCHTASIFPHSPAAAERERKVVPATSPVPPVQRVTITLPVIAKARRLVTLAYGSHKAKAVATAIEGHVSYEECPARVARDGIWVMDTGAASALRDT